MFPSSANHNNNGYFLDPLPFFSDVTNTSVTSLSFSSFSIPSSPFYLYHDPDSFSQPVMDNNCAAAAFAGDNGATDVVITETSQKEKLPKKRSAKKDRHSKINTAQGPRDRRMRLSLEVARKFFDLQDMLEFDKASKTVEWLLKQSKSAIKELSNGRDGGSPCSSECDVVSGVIDEFVDGSNNSSAVNDDPDKVPKKEKKIATRTQKCRGIVARESRKKARERAKERTMEKMSIRKQLISSNLSNGAARDETGTVEESGIRAQLDEAKELGLMDEQILGSCYSFNGTYGISQEQPFRDFQMLLNSWEAYSNSTHLC